MLSIVPGTELHFDTIGTPGPLYPLPVGWKFGSGSFLDDGDDASYIELAESNSGDFFSFRHFYAQMGTADLSPAGLSWFVRANQTTTDVQLTPPMLISVGFLSKDSGSSEEDFGNSWSWFWSFEIGKNTDFTDYSGALTASDPSLSRFPFDLTLDDVLRHISDGEAWVTISHFGTPTPGLFNGLVDSLVSEFYLFNVTTGMPPIRHYPRQDGLGASSAARRYPPPRSTQASPRRAGGYL